MSYDRRLETAERCARMLQALVSRGLLKKLKQADEIDDFVFMECGRSLDNYEAARSRPETS